MVGCLFDAMVDYYCRVDYYHITNCIFNSWLGVYCKMTTLVNGKIPEKTVCPFRAHCSSAINGTCGHKGVLHEVAYSCGYARLFKIYFRE